MLLHFERQAQLGNLLFDEALTKISAEYSDYSNVFLAENVAELLENIGINKYAIELKEDKQPSFGSIYNLDPVELETLKTYINIRKIFYLDPTTLCCFDLQIKQIACRLSLNTLIQTKSPQIYQITPAMSDQPLLHNAPRSPYTTVATLST